MSFAKSTRVGILRGGPSHEYDVSLKTGGVMAANLPDHCLALDIWISKDGVWHVDGFEKSPENVLRSVDLVLNGLHGNFGEDGQVQKILDHHKIPYAGSNAVASAVAMNKNLSKQSFSKLSIKTPVFINIEIKNKEEELSIAKLRQIEQQIYESLPFPIIIKPVNGGSSIGVSYVSKKEELAPAIKKAFQYSSKILAEEFIKGIEVTSGIIEDFRGSPLYTLTPVAIEKHPEKFFHDYESKYGDVPSPYQIPAQISPIQKIQIEETARQVHRALHLRDYSRTDMIVHPRRGIYVLEVNTLPEISHRSSFVKSLEALGSNVKEFLSHLVDRTLKRRS